MAAKRTPPAPRELDVLSALWELGPSSVRDEREELASKRKNLAYTTVQTLLNRLVDKGQVRLDTRQVPYVYRAAVPRDKMRSVRVRQLAHELFEGRTVPLVSHALRDAELDEDDLRELRELLDAHARKRPLGRNGEKP